MSTGMKLLAPPRRVDISWSYGGLNSSEEGFYSMDIFINQSFNWPFLTL
jgi:hypothetical protein